MAPSLLVSWGLLLCSGLLLGSDVPTPRLEPYDYLFDNGVEAYYRGDWHAVILHMEKALRNRELLRRHRISCRLQCASLFGFEDLPPNWVPVTDLRFFQNVLKRAECLKSCEMEKSGALSTFYITSEELELEFRKRSPYNYLQVAYFKIHKLDKAVSAAYTFYMANPDHMEMRQNLEYYKMMAGVKDSDFRDLEGKPHMEEFRLGVGYYTDEEQGTSIIHFEKALEEYFAADQECCALCEGPYDYDGYNYMDYTADLFLSITDHYVQTMNCRQNCVLELALQPGREKPIEDFLPSHFNYLQFAYYSIENYTKAIESAKTYLLFHPNDEVMNQNLAYYVAVFGEEQGKLIQPRGNIKTYIQRSLLEKELLFFAYDSFGIPFVDPDIWTPENIMPKRLREKQKLERETAARISEEIGNLMKEIETLVEEKNKETLDFTKAAHEGGSVLFDEISVVMNSNTLNGSRRVVTDGVITEDECRELLRLTYAAASTGDGYRGTTSPHTPNEKFSGVTVYKALKLGQEGKVPLRSAHLYYNVTDKVRRVVESYFRLESPLYFSYSHLVCRTAIEEKQSDRKDLSHPVHVDNCILNSEAMMCIKEHPAYTFRDYSAILYLNGDFEGGSFYFTELDAKTVTAEVQPQCGRMVGFSSGAENPHGVKAVTKGQRCAVALWFTLDPRHNERERVQADDLIKMLFHTEETFQEEEQNKVPGETESKQQDVTLSQGVVQQNSEVSEEGASKSQDAVEVDSLMHEKDAAKSQDAGEVDSLRHEKDTAKSQDPADQSSETLEEDASKSQDAADFHTIQNSDSYREQVLSQSLDSAREKVEL
ncbi:prolyl 3-hydroxylase 1 [Bombina bombina]|uniref:prolyl 3-hydroxylase 1 n=1 Tax=Bombina bombina TaxID=8345 RepID=UPI00235A9AD1|nr:prolyl 3-hydroxylase 1 [Bombina bombina]